MPEVTIDENRISRIFRNAEGHFFDFMADVMKTQQLSPDQAFVAMMVFLDRYYARTGVHSDPGALLGDLLINERDGLPLDPATWTDWLSAVDEVLEREHSDAAQSRRHSK
jgi:hypothetical protein